MNWLKRRIINAAPTCTLWRYCANWDGYIFVLYPKWRLSFINGCKRHKWLNEKYK